MAGELEVGSPTAAAVEAPGAGHGAAAPLGSPAQELQAAEAASSPGSRSSSSSAASCSPAAVAEPLLGPAAAEPGCSPGSSSTDVLQQAEPGDGEPTDNAIVREASEGPCPCELQLLLGEDGTVTARLCIRPAGEEGPSAGLQQPECAECTTAAQAGQPGDEPGGDWAAAAAGPAAAELAPLLAPTADAASAEPASGDAGQLQAAAQQHLMHLTALQEQRRQLAKENAFLQRCARQVRVALPYTFSLCRLPGGYMPPHPLAETERTCVFGSCLRMWPCSMLCINAAGQDAISSYSSPNTFAQRTKRETRNMPWTPFTCSTLMLRARRPSSPFTLTILTAHT